MSSELATNPLLGWTEFPAFDQIKIEHIEPAVRATLEKAEIALTALEVEPPTTWKGLMEPLERLDDEVGRLWGVISHLHAVKNSPELREVYQPLLADVVKFSNRMGQSKPMYTAFLSLRDSAESATFDSAQRRILDSAIQEAELNGVGLDDTKRARYNAISERQAELGTKISNNVLDATKAFKLKLTAKDQTEGLPGSLLELAADTAKREGDESATPESGPWIITLDHPSYLPFLQHSTNRDLREKIYRAHVTRASEGDSSNADNITETLALRREKAQLLGYPTYASLSLSRKMAPDVPAVERLLEELRTASLPSAVQDLADINAVAQSQHAPEADHLAHWDVAYWSERLREARYDINEEQLRPYFPLPQVLQGMFDLTQRLFDVRVIEADGQAPIWHEDVRFFRVLNGHGVPIAGFYLDAYSRPEEKRGGAWMNVLTGRSKVMAPPGKTVRLPIAYMVCNQSRPVSGKPSLMTFQDVETLFHEFGHALQHMLTTIDYGAAAGLSNVEWDAVEIASQFMENWCYHPPTLRGLARHYETGEQLPEDLMDRILAARTFRAGTSMLRQINFGLFDMELHHRFDPADAETVLDVQRRIERKTLILEPIPDDRFYCAFTHIFAGGYAAGYYSYKWSEVLSADAFSAFIEAGTDKDAEMKRLGLTFRDTLLALGGSVAPMDVFRAFRGREPSTAPLLRQNGLLASVS